MRFCNRVFTLFVLLLSMIALKGCQPGENPGDSQTEAIDYNQYIYCHGATAYTEEAYVFLENNQLYFLEKTLSAPITKMCIRPNCSHTDNSCSAYLDSHSVFASDNKLYYISENEEGHYGLYEMALDGRERKFVKALPVLDASGLGFSYRIYGDYLALEVSHWSVESSSYVIYLTDFGDPGAEIIPVFGGRENTTVAYSAPELRDGWMFVWAYEIATKEKELMGYDLKTGEIYSLVKDWEGINSMSLKNNILYWFAPGAGFYSMSLTDRKETRYRTCEPDYEYGAGTYDDQYIYFTNAIPQLIERGMAAEDKIGLYIYDYEGNLKQYISTKEASMYPVFLLSTPEYVFFYDASDGVFPRWYLKKDDIPSQKAALIELE